jgi:carboxypeptidase C (cathepsin A)
MRLRLMLLLLSVSFFAPFLHAQESDHHEQQSAAAPQTVTKGGKLPELGEKPPEPEPPQRPEPEPVITHHQITINGKTLHYTATTGRLPIKDDEGKIEAKMFFIAYSLDGAGPKRPLTFSFNGGPGSSSVWLQLGAIGPRRVRLLPSGFMPKPPFELEDNQYTWLDQTDLVFIDPVGTGYSRATNKDEAKKFYSVDGDIESVGDFIRLYLGRYERWASPLFLAGESYGTTRAAGLSGYLMDHGVALNGIVLVSTVLNFQTSRFTQGNDLPYVLFLPSYTAAAWYHKKLPPDLQTDFKKALAESEQYASGPYTDALAKGDRLSPRERQSVIDTLSRLTGLSKQYIENADLRVAEHQFGKELLRNEHEIIGRIDGRFTAPALNGVAEEPSFDPSIAETRPPFTSMFNQYVRTELGYKTDLQYTVLGMKVNEEWNWGSAVEGFPNVTEALREAFVKNNYMKMFVASGWFDLATPYYATQYTLAHLALPPKLMNNISTGYYDSGHMIYLHDQSLARLKQDVSKFMESALK